jgi:sodium-dependent dicarboxylate transporter 2/3/5
MLPGMQGAPRRIATRARKAFIVAGPVLFLAVLLGPELDPARPAVGRTAAVAVLMAFYWLTDAIPLAATALLPVVLFPFLGVLEANETASFYVNDVIFLFIGGFLLAGAMERWQLHRRIALRIILAVGRDPSRLLLGFMAASWFLSGWISNTATALMMVPIVMALAVEFERKGGASARAFTVALLLGIAYACSIGGMATLIGTPPNLALARIYTLSFPRAPEITFLGWMKFALPLSIVLFAIAYAYLRLVIVRRPAFAFDHELLDAEYRALGPMAWEEKIVLWVFATFVALIVTRADVDLGGSVFRGWASRLGVAGFVRDGTVSVGVASILFLIPARSERRFLLGGGAVAKLPWDIVILFGGGFALAQAFTVSGLSEFLGSRLVALRGVHPLLLLLAVCTMITFLTELTSNTATTQVVLPIIASLCVVLDLHPLFLMVPATISASCAFMLPVATPPNAIVFGTHRLRVADMARAGLALNLLAVLTVALVMYLFGRAAFGIDLDSAPAWLYTSSVPG